MYGNMYPNYMQFQQPARQELVRVSGDEAANAYQIAPGSVVPLFHESDDIMYIVSADGAGFKKTRKFRFTEIVEDRAANEDKIDKLLQAVEELKGLMKNGEQPVRE